MALELQIGTGTAAKNLATIEEAVTRLQGKLQSFNGGNFTTVAGQIGSMKPPPPGVATGLEKIGTSSTKAATGMRTASSASGGLMKSLGGLRTVAAGLGVSLGGIGIANFIKTGFEMTNAMTKVNNTFTAMTDDAKMGARALKFVSKTADDTALSISAIAQTYTTFGASALASGTSVATTEKVYGKLAKVFRSLGLTTEQSKRTFKGFEQIITKGSFQMEELKNQIGENIPAFKILADSMGVTTDELAKLMANGKVGIENLIPFVDRLEAKLGKGLAAALKTPEAAMQTLNNGWVRLAEAFVKDMFTPLIGPIISLGKSMSALSQQTNGPLQRAGQLAGILGGALVSALQLLVEHADVVVAAFAAFATHMAVLMAINVGTYFMNLGKSALAAGNAILAMGQKTQAATGPMAAAGNNMTRMQRTMAALRGGIGGFVMGIAGLASGLALAAGAYAIFMVATGQTEELINQVKTALYALGEVFGYSKSEVDEMITAVVAFGKAVVNWVVGAIKNAKTTFKDFLTGADAIYQGLVKIASYVSGAFISAWNSVTGVVRGVADAIADAVQGIISWVERAITVLRRLLSLQASAGSSGEGKAGAQALATGGVAGQWGGKNVSVPSSAFNNAPHFAKGGTTQGMGGGGIPAVLHPNEAVIPLKGGAVPVTFKSAGSSSQSGGASSAGDVPVILKGLGTSLGRIQDRLETGLRNIDSSLMKANDRLLRMENTTKIMSEGIKTLASKATSSVSYGGGGGGMPPGMPSPTMPSRGGNENGAAGLFGVANRGMNAGGGGFGPSGGGNGGGFLGVSAPKMGSTTLGLTTGNMYMGVSVNPNYQKELAEYLERTGISMEEFQAWQNSQATRGSWGTGGYTSGLARGTPNTSREGLRRTGPGGGMAVTVHPDEAVIPLPDGRRVPVMLKQSSIPQMQQGGNSNGRGGGGNVINMVVQTPDAASFKRNQRQMMQDMSVELRRAQKNINVPAPPDLSAPRQRLWKKE